MTEEQQLVLLLKVVECGALTAERDNYKNGYPGKAVMCEVVAMIAERAAVSLHEITSKV